MTNFDFLLSDTQFTTFGEVAIAAEKIYTIDPAACALNCRRGVEFAVKWMYSVDGGLVMPYDDRLARLMDTEDFRAIVNRDLWQSLKYIRQTGNAAAHTGKKIGCAWKTSGTSWTLSPAATAPLTPPEHLTQLCWRSRTPPQFQLPRPRWIWPPSWRKTRLSGQSSPPAGRPSSPATPPSPWTSPSTRPASCTSTPCSPTPAGRRGRTG